MAENVTLAPLANLSNDGTAIATINANNTIIENAFEDCLSLNGTVPNAMLSNLDMNNFNIINLPAPSTIHSPARLIDVVSNPTLTIINPTLPVLNLRNYGAVGNGIADDTTAILNWLTAIQGTSGPVAGYAPMGNYIFKSALTVGTGGKTDVTIYGDGAYTTIFTYAGASTTVNLLTIGDGSLEPIGWSLHDFRIASNTTMTAGTALWMRWMGRSFLHHIVMDGQDGNGKLWNGFWFDGIAQVYIDNFEARGANDALRVNGRPLIHSAGLFMRGGKISSSNVGVRIGGAFGGFSCDETDIITNNVNVLIDQTLIASPNDQIFFGKSAWLDSAVSTPNLSLIDVGGANSLLICVGTWIATGPGIGLYIGPSCTYRVNYTGGVITNHQHDGVYDASGGLAKISLVGVRIDNNGGSGTGYGVNASISNPDITINSCIFQNNVSGSTQFKFKSAGPINVANIFGLVGDDSTNNDTAIANWVTFMNANYGLSYYVPQGNYRFNSTWPSITTQYTTVTCDGLCYFRHTSTTADSMVIGAPAQQSTNFTLKNAFFWPVNLRTSGTDIVIQGGSFDTVIEDCNFFYTFNPIHIKCGTNVSIVRPTFRFIYGTAGVDITGVSPSLVNNAVTINTVSADNPWYSGPNISQIKTRNNTTAYNLGDIYIVNSSVWQVVTAGTTGTGTGPYVLPSASSTAPYTTDIVDGTVHLRFITSVNLAWVRMGSYSDSVTLIACRLLNGYNAVKMEDVANTGTSYPAWCFTYDLECDHNYGDCVLLTAGRGFRGHGSFFGSSQTLSGVNETLNYLGETILNGCEIIGNAAHGVVLNNASGYETLIESCVINYNGAAIPNTYNGVSVVAGRGDFQIIGNRFGPNNGGSTDNQHAAVLTGGTNANYIVVNNVAKGQGNGSTAVLAYLYGAAQTNQINASAGNIAY